MGIVERKIREKEQRIQEILNAARFLFITKGYRNTTMHDIAEESELSRRTLYIYFQNKEKLSYLVMKEAYELLYKKIKTSIDGCDGSGYDKIETIGNTYLDFYENNFDQLIFTLYFDYKINAKDMDDDEAIACFNIMQKIIEELVGIIDDGIKDGSIRAVEDSHKTALTAMTMIQSTMQKMAVRNDWITSRYKLTGKEIIEEMFAIFYAFVKA
ncbi:MAG: TetR/AcrR family transcriptional regulator [Spirochaetales bacterium]|nr:TetR/AcrR family transcriptional regulator [Spirochaetales bacterium]